MNRDPHAIGYWKTVRLLLGAARQRSKGRQKRQQELLRNRSGGRAGNWSGLGFGLSVFFMLLLNVLAAIATSTAVEAGQRIAAEHQGKIVVDRWFYDAVDSRTDSADSSNSQADDTPPGAPDAEQYADEARSIAERYGG